MRVLAALSGGVDSAVAAALAKEAGHEVTAVHMALSATQAATRCGSRGCCTVEDAADARRAAAMLDIPFYVWDMAEVFHETVISDFLHEYEQGRTPNPCVRCNEFVKFRELLQRARELDFDAVCTGHYANLRVGNDGEVFLSKATCIAKDQSYVVAVMGEEAIRQVLFPLGEFASKAEVRAEAAKRGFPMSAKPDSYDICFIPDGDTRGFLQKHLGAKPGEFVDETGRVLGKHDGAYQFTVGQRRGLQLLSTGPITEPRYVLRTNMHTNQVVVGAAELLSVDYILAKKIVPLAPLNHPGLQGQEEVTVQYRAHGKQIPAQVKLHAPTHRPAQSTDEQVLSAQLAEATRAVAAGQSLVVYTKAGRALAEATIELAQKQSRHI